jgi:hypothetical protein
LEEVGVREVVWWGWRMGRGIVVVLDGGAYRPESILKKFGGLGVRVFIHHRA